MDIDDKYYKKYIKYKTKYLELQQNEGGGFGIGKKSNYGGYLDTLNQVLKKESSFDKKNKDIKYNEVKIKYIEENLLNLLTAIYSANNSIIDIQNNIIKFYLCILNIKLYYTQLFYYQDRDPRVIVNNDNYINMFQGRYQDNTIEIKKNITEMNGILKNIPSYLKLKKLSKSYLDSIDFILKNNIQININYTIKQKDNNLLDTVKKDIESIIEKNLLIVKDSKIDDKNKIGLLNIIKHQYQLKVLCSDDNDKNDNITLINNYITVSKIYIFFKLSKQDVEIRNILYGGAVNYKLINNNIKDALFRIILIFFKGNPHKKNTGEKYTESVEFNGTTYTIVNSEGRNIDEVKRLLNSINMYIEEYIPEYLSEIKNLINI